MTKKHCHLGDTYDPTCIGCEAVNDEKDTNLGLSIHSEKDVNYLAKQANDEKEKKCVCTTKYCPHYESDFDRFLKENQSVVDESNYTHGKNPILESPVEKGWEEKQFSPRMFGKITPQLLEFYVANRQGKSVIFRSPEGSMYTQKAVDNLLSSERERVVKKIEEYFSQQIHAQYPPIVKKSLLYFLSTHND